jgi:hypothetical protein
MGVRLSLALGVYEPCFPLAPAVQKRKGPRRPTASPPSVVPEILLDSGRGGRIVPGEGNHRRLWKDLSAGAGAAASPIAGPIPIGPSESKDRTPPPKPKGTSWSNVRNAEESLAGKRERTAWRRFPAASWETNTPSLTTSANHAESTRSRSTTIDSAANRASLCKGRCPKPKAMPRLN